MVLDQSNFSLSKISVMLGKDEDLGFAIIRNSTFGRLQTIGNIHIELSDSILVGTDHPETEIGLRIQEGYLNISNSKFVGNIVEEKPAIIQCANCSINMTNTHFVKNKVPKDLVHLTDTSRIVISYSTFEDNKAIGGSVLHLETHNTAGIAYSTFNRNQGIAGSCINSQMSTVNIQNSSFTNNSAIQGGAVSAYLSDIIISGSVFTNNQGKPMTFFDSTQDSNLFCTFCGGAIVALHLAFLQVQDCVFVGNTASGQAGSVLVAMRSLSFIDRSVFKDNFANEVGAVQVTANSSLTLNGCVFEENRGGQDSGAVHVSVNSTLTVIESKFLNNTSTTSGAILIYSKSKGQIFNSEFTENSALQNGGAVCFFNESVGDVINSSFTGNSASKGGALLVAVGGQVSLVNSEFMQNKAWPITDSTADDSWGGAIYVSSNSTVTIKNSTLESNSAKTGGGAMDIVDSSTCSVSQTSFLHNFAPKQGGAVCVDQASGTKFTDCHFNENSAMSGGAFYVHDRSIMNIKRCYFSQNNASFGGALMTTGHTLCFVDHSGFTGNTATAQNQLGDVSSGGAAYIGEQSIMIIDSTNFENNSALTEAGAVAVKEQSICNISGSTFVNNEVIGVNITLSGTSLLEQTFLWKSSAKTSAGTVSVDKSTIDIKWSSFVENKAPRGGAIVLKRKSAAIINFSNFTENVACSHAEDNTTQGGAIFMFQSSANITSSRFEKNYAVFGGAIVNHEKSVLDVGHCSFIANKALGHLACGGAVASFNGSTATISDSHFANNVADHFGGALYTADSLFFRVRRCQFENNSARKEGGAVSFVRAKFSVFHSQILNNTGYDGGGLTVTNAHVVVENVTLKDNTASNTGGALSLFSSSVTAVECDFAGNGANNGGGSISALVNTSLSLSKTSFASESTTNMAGGILTLSFNVTFSATNCTFRELGTSGDAIFVIMQTQAAFLNCHFVHNHGKLVTTNLAQASFVRCAFIRNQDENLFMMLLVSGRAHLSNCVFGGNRFAGLASAMKTTISVEACVISNNTVGNLFVVYYSLLNVQTTEMEHNSAENLVTASESSTLLNFCSIKDNTFSAGTFVMVGSNFSLHDISFVNNLGHDFVEMITQENHEEYTVLELCNVTSINNVFQSSEMIFLTKSAVNIQGSFFSNPTGGTSIASFASAEFFRVADSQFVLNPNQAFLIPHNDMLAGRTITLLTHDVKFKIGNLTILSSDSRFLDKAIALKLFKEDSPLVPGSDLLEHLKEQGESPYASSKYKVFQQMYITQKNLRPILFSPFTTPASRLRALYFVEAF